MVIIYFTTSIVLTYLTVFMLDSYMNRGEILDWIRIGVAQYISKKKGIEFNIEELENIDNYESPQYFERAQAYEIKFWEIAYHTKLINPFICKTCMSFYIGLFYAIGFIYFLSLGFAFSVAFVFVQNLIVFFLIELKSN